jgi:hypothetical protein
MNRVVFRPLCWLIFGHEPIIEINEKENKSEYVCERCRAILGDFVTNLRKPRAKPVEGMADSEPRNRAGAEQVSPSALDVLHSPHRAQHRWLTRQKGETR